jgi:hypothetical protein
MNRREISTLFGHPHERAKHREPNEASTWAHFRNTNLHLSALVEKGGRRPVVHLLVGMGEEYRHCRKNFLIWLQSAITLNGGFCHMAQM